MTSAMFAILSALLFAATFFLRKLGGQHFSSSFALLMEVTISWLLLVSVVAWFYFNSGASLPIKNQKIFIPILSGVAVTLAIGFNFLALKSGGLSKIGLITSPSQIIFLVLMGNFFLGESLSPKQLMGGILSVAGLILIIS